MVSLKKILPLASAHEQVLVSDFAQGKSSLSDLINLRKNILNYKLALAQAYEVFAVEQIEQEKILAGVGLDSIQRNAPSPIIKRMGESSSMSAGKTAGDMSFKSKGKKEIKNQEIRAGEGDIEDNSELNSSAQGM